MKNLLVQVTALVAVSVFASGCYTQLGSTREESVTRRNTRQLLRISRMTSIIPKTNTMIGATNCIGNTIARLRLSWCPCMTRGHGEIDGVGVFDSLHGTIQSTIRSTTHRSDGTVVRTILQFTPDGGHQHTIRGGDGILITAMDGVVDILAAAVDVVVKHAPSV